MPSPEPSNPRPFHGIVAIDGPSGAGKSTVARALANRLAARYLDTGAMYRAVTWAVLQEGAPLDDVAAIADVVGRTEIAISTDPRRPTISVDGRSVDAAIRTDAVTAAVSAVSAVPQVRERMVDLQRELIGAGGIVLEGRDTGSVVAPQAELKVFLTASASARAGRRSTELGGNSADAVAATAAALTRRDDLDSTRVASPFQPAPDALVIDTTQLGVDDVVALLYELTQDDAQSGVDSAPET